MTQLVGFAGSYTGPDSEMHFAGHGFMATAAPTILFDGKTLNADDTTDLWENVGTGTFTYQTNKMQMAVDSGQHCIRQSRRSMAYYAGYPLQTEFTTLDFDSEAGVTKRVGYFSSSPVSPHTADLDGYWLEDDGTTKRLVVYNAGNEVFNVPYNDWSGRGEFEASDGGSTYDWSTFTVLMFDFLWLGGAVLRMWIRLGSKWQLLHAVSCINSKDELIFKTPQQPMRYEIRGNSAAGNFKAVCCQASVLGSVDRNGSLRSSVNTVGVAANTKDVVYALQGIKKRAAFRDVAVEIESIAMGRSAGNDTGLLMLLRNPTLSAALVYSPYGKIDRAIATGQTVTDLNEIVIATPAADLAQEPIAGNYRRWLTQNITDGFDEYVLAYQSITTNQTVYGILNYKEHG